MTIGTYIGLRFEFMVPHWTYMIKLCWRLKHYECEYPINVDRDFIGGSTRRDN